MRGMAVYLTIIDSSFETLATILLILVCMGNAYSGYCDVLNMAIYDQFCDHLSNPHVRIIRQWMLRFIVAGLLLIGTSLGFFVLCLCTYRLWWTILSNNVCMIAVQVFTGFYRYRVAMAVTRIHEDQMKVWETNCCNFSLQLLE
jgi:hypothetical protein